MLENVPRKVLLLLILTMAAWIRFHGLAGQGFFLFDEGRYLLEAARLREHLVWSLKEIPALWPDTGALLPAVERVFSGQAVAPGVVSTPAGGIARPLHILGLVLSGAGESGGLLYIASIGILGVWLMSRMASPMTGCASAGVFAAMLLATSPAHAFYSRTLLAEIPAITLLLAAVTIYLSNSRLRRTFLAGLAFGSALAVQSRLFLVIPIIMIWDVIEHRSPRRFMILLAGILLPIALVEGFYLLMKVIFLARGRPDFFQTYMEQWIEVAGFDRGRFALNQPLFALNYILAVEGVVPSVLFIAGIVMAVRRKNRKAGLIAVCALWIMAIATLYDPIRWGGPRWGRMLSPALGLVAAVAAYPLSLLWERGNRGLVALLCVLILAERSEILMETAGMRSDYREILSESYRLAPSPAFFSDEPMHITWYLQDSGVVTDFVPERDTTTVVIFDINDAPYHGFFHALPDTASFVLAPRDHRPSRLQWLDHRGVRGEWFRLKREEISPAFVIVLPRGYANRVKNMRIY